MARSHYKPFFIKDSMPVTWFIALCSVLTTWKTIGTGSMNIQIICFGFLGIIGIIFLTSKNKSYAIVFIFSILAFALPMEYGFARYLFIMSFVILAMRKIDNNGFAKLISILAILILLIFVQKYRSAYLVEESLFYTGLQDIFFIGLGFLCLDLKGIPSCLYMFAVIGAIVSLLNYILPSGTYGIQTINTVTRMVAANLDPNYYAGVYIYPLVSSLLLIQTATTIRRKGLWLVLCLIILMGIMGTGSRGALLCAMFILFLCIVHYMRRKGVSIKFQIIAFSCVMAIFTLKSIYYTPMYSRLDKMDIEESFSKEYNKGGRIGIWDKYVYDVIPNNLLFGQGFDWPVHTNIKGEIVQTAAHNTYIQVIADNGIIGTSILILCLLPCIRAYWFLLQQYAMGTKLMTTELFLFISYTGFLLTNFFLTGYPDNLLFLSSGLMLRLGFILPTMRKYGPHLNNVNRRHISVFGRTQVDNIISR
jgi:hypothetical protein